MSAGLSEKLRQLDEFLLSEAVGDEAMLLSELDGFLAGIVVCPEPIIPSEWLPVVWGEDGPMFEEEHQAQAILDLVMGHYNDIIRRLDGGGYAPVYDIDNDDSILWETWIEGFGEALRLRPEAWLAWAESENAELQRAWFVLGRLAGLATSPNGVEPMEIDEELEELAPDLIPEAVEILHRARKIEAASTPGPANENRPRVGHNDPCPCGSGKKFKKCCLNR